MSCLVWKFGVEGPPGVSSCWGCVDVPAERFTNMLIDPLKWKISTTGSFFC